MKLTFLTYMSRIKILFHSPQLDHRGTCVSLYDYAVGNEDVLNNQSVIILPIESKVKNDIDVLLKFERRFRILFYVTDEELCKYCCDFNLIYFIKYGKKDKELILPIPSVIHCVFDMSEPHGKVYAGVSEQLAKKFGSELFVPHMISLVPVKGDLRKSLNIPTTSLVFGRHGGVDTFDLQFVKQIISEIVKERNDIYFIFLGTKKFYDHPKIVHLPIIIDVEEKSRFINTCDAMIHGQSLGETFGISIGEFSVHNKPIITYGGVVWNDSYRQILGSGAIYYNNDNELKKILLKFKKIEGDLNFYKYYNKYDVMNKFNEVFL